ncbi:hypothetical protein FRX31_025937 [Thalictrum thalictroides]|uniref:Uncharacterized protein n=1 Tax=Thalictrum thalictroides TaxID=46969 RepID=A0A7J6VHA2_THATH|nr:hypothetical protein FRX31_025937 [Thalictrum thalictroides]
MFPNVVSLLPFTTAAFGFNLFSLLLVLLGNLLFDYCGSNALKVEEGCTFRPDLGLFPKSNIVVSYNGLGMSLAATSCSHLTTSVVRVICCTSSVATLLNTVSFIMDKLSISHKVSIFSGSLQYFLISFPILWPEQVENIQLSAMISGDTIYRNNPTRQTS